MLSYRLWRPMSYIINNDDFFFNYTHTIPGVYAEYDNKKKNGCSDCVEVGGSVHVRLEWLGLTECERGLVPSAVISLLGCL